VSDSDSYLSDFSDLREKWNADDADFLDLRGLILEQTSSALALAFKLTTDYTDLHRFFYGIRINVGYRAVRF